MLALGCTTSMSASSSGHRSHPVSLPQATVRETRSSLRALSEQALGLGGQVGGRSHSRHLGLSITWPQTGLHEENV